MLVHSEAHMTYVAERNLEPDDQAAIDHPALDAYFDELRDGRSTSSLPAREDLQSARPPAAGPSAIKTCGC